MLLFFFLALWLTSCTETPQQRIGLTSMDHLQTEKRASIIEGIQKFNSVFQDQIINETSEGYQITFDVQDQELLNSIPPAVSNQTTRNGHSVMANNRCEVTLSELAFQPQKNSIFLSVLFHELGHCVGLNHEPVAGEIMSPYPIGFYAYTQSSMEKFQSDYKGAIRSLFSNSH